ncbi:hypothetical protein ACWC0C_32145 [Streptomyces sp. NPDC001709]
MGRTPGPTRLAAPTAAAAAFTAPAVLLGTLHAGGVRRRGAG